MDCRLRLINKHIQEGIIPNPIINGCEVSHIYIDTYGRSILHITHKEYYSMRECVDNFRRIIKLYDSSFFIIFNDNKYIIKIPIFL